MFEIMKYGLTNKNVNGDYDIYIKNELPPIVIPIQDPQVSAAN